MWENKGRLKHFQMFLGSIKNLLANFRPFSILNLTRSLIRLIPFHLPYQASSVESKRLLFTCMPTSRLLTPLMEGNFRKYQGIIMIECSHWNTLDSIFNVYWWYESSSIKASLLRVLWEFVVLGMGFIFSGQVVLYWSTRCSMCYFASRLCSHSEHARLVHLIYFLLLL